MENQKWLYFAAVPDEVNLNGIDDCVALPAKNLISISPTANNRVTMYFESVQNCDPLGAPDTVVLETIVGDAFEVANAIVRFINASVPHDGFITIADDVTTTDHVTTALADLTVSPQYCHGSITGVNSINISSDVTSVHDYGWGLHAGVTPTVQPADTSTLVVNNHYVFGTGAARGYRIPAAADGRAGDWISVVYSANITDEANHTFTTTTDAAYIYGSIIRVIGNDGTRVGVVDTSGSGDNIVTIAGLTNGDGGIGTRVMFRNMTGEVDGWAVECVVEGQGAQNVASADTAFS